MKRYRALCAGAGLLLCLTMLFLFFLFPSDQAVQAFNQQNLIRAVEVHEADGRLYYRRLAPVNDLFP